MEETAIWCGKPIPRLKQLAIETLYGGGVLHQSLVDSTGDLSEELADEIVRALNRAEKPYTFGDILSTRRESIVLTRGRGCDIAIEWSPNMLPSLPNYQALRILRLQLVDKASIIEELSGLLPKLQLQVFALERVQVSLPAPILDQLLVSIAECPAIQDLTLSIQFPCIIRPQLHLATLKRVLPPLTSLTLDGWYRLTDDHLLDLLPACPNVVHLALPRCTGLSDRAVEFIAQTFSTRLRTLNLTGCVRLSSRAIQEVARLCPSLVGLMSSSLSQLTDAGVQSLPSLRQLTALELDHCHHLTAGYECRTGPQVGE